jgi:hypothetical protein
MTVSLLIQSNLGDKILFSARSMIAGHVHAGQGHSSDDDECGIDIIPLDDWHGMLH